MEYGFLGDGENKKARLWLFFSFIVAFGAVFGAMWIGIQVWLTRPEMTSDGAPPMTNYPGIAIIVQNMLIFTAALIFRFAKPQVDEFGEPVRHSWGL